MKNNVKPIVALLLSVLLCFPVTVFAEEAGEPVAGSSVIDPYILPEYVEGESMEALGLTKRLEKYDSPDKLNVVGFSTQDGNEMVKLFPVDVKYVEDDKVIDKSAKLEQVKKRLFFGNEYSYKNISNDFDLYFPNDITENPLKIQADNNSISVMPIGEEHFDTALLVDDTTVEYSDGSRSFEIKSNLNGVEIVVSEDKTEKIQDYVFELNGYVPSVSDDGTVLLRSEAGKEYAVSAFENKDGTIYNASSTFTEEDDGKYAFSVNATSYTINVTEISQSIFADAPVYSFFHNKNLGSYQSAVLGTNSLYDIGRMYVKFDLSALNEISYDRVISAYYRVYKFGNFKADMKMDAYLVRDEWEEDTVTWDEKPGYLNERLCTTNSCEDHSSMDSGEEKSDFYITQAVQAWLQGVTNNGILIKERNDSGTISYIQKEGSGSYPYSLNIIYATESFSSKSIGIDEGKYYIKSKINNMLMTASGSQVIQKNLLDDPSSQVWYLQYEGNGYYSISPMSDRTKVVKNTANISLVNEDYSSYALWRIRRNWDGSFSMMNKQSNDTKDISVGVNYYTEGYPLIYSSDSMGLRKYDDWTFIPASKGNASIFGFKGTPPVLNTQDEEKNAKALLDKLGYNSTVYENQTAAVALAKMTSSSIFAYYGHGESGCLGFEFKDSGSQGGYNISFLAGGPSNWLGDSNVYTLQSLHYNALKNQTLTLFDACLAGRDMPQYDSDGNASSLVGMTYFRGSHYVVGFMNLTYSESPHVLSKLLYSKLAEGLTIYEAFDYIDNHLEEYLEEKNVDEDLIPFYDWLHYRTWLGDNSMVYNLPDFK